MLQMRMTLFLNSHQVKLQLRKNHTQLTCRDASEVSAQERLSPFTKDVQHVRNPIKPALLPQGCQSLTAHVTGLAPSLLISSRSEVQTAKSFGPGSFFPSLYRFARLAVRKVVEDSAVSQTEMFVTNPHRLV